MSHEWTEIIQEQQKQDYYYSNLAPFLKEEYANYECYPVAENVFRALYATKSPDNVKVVILGQDPYHEPGQAMGLSFSVPEGCPNPPSLQNIIKEVKYEYQIDDNIDRKLYHGDLTYLAEQGVLLLNTTLTVRKGEPNSHSNCGWQIFTDSIIEYLNDMNEPMVFMLWGKYAQRKKRLITNDKILVLTTSHPSPFSANRGFMGCNHFIKCNEFLKQHYMNPIDWLGGEIC